MTIKVLMLLHNLRVSAGVATFVMNYLRIIDSAKYHFEFEIYRDVPYVYYDEIKQMGSEVFVLPPITQIKRHMSRCREILVEGKYDIIHDNSLLITYPMMSISTDIVKIRILHSHNSKFGDASLKAIRNKLFFPLLLKTANHYTACSPLAGQTLFKDKHFDVIPNIINVSSFKFNSVTREKIREMYNCRDKIVVGSVGRMTEQKNPFFAVDVMEKVIAAIPNVEYWWIGSGNLDQKIRRYIEKKDLLNKIKLFGSRNDANELLQGMDLFFLPSRFEGFCYACLEAQAAGLQCVVSDCLPKDVDVSGNVSFVSLKDSTDRWIEEVISNLNKKIGRQVAYGAVEDSVYVADKCNNALSNLYFKLVAKAM